MCGIFGPPGGHSFATYDRDSCCWRTYHLSLLTGCASRFSGTLPPQGTMRSGVLSERTTSGLPTAETAGGSGPNTEGLRPTPLADGPSWTDRKDFEQGGMALGSAVHRWHTPHGLNYEEGQCGGEFDKQVRERTYPTLDAHCWKLGNRSNGTGGPLLSNSTVDGAPAGGSTRPTWSTPTARDRHTLAKTKRGKGSAASGNEKIVPLGHQAARVAGQTKGQLHPCWVEWLMGFPIGWTVCDASETPSCRTSSRGSGDG